MGANEYDLAVVGAGPGGYVAAIRAAQLGLRVAVVESDQPGGVCLNWGCIPTKALLTGAELLESLRQRGSLFGIDVGGLRLDYARAVAHSRSVAERLGRGVVSLFRRHRIELVRGRARLSSPTSLQLEGSEREAAERDGLDAQHVVLATGSREWLPAGVRADGERVLTSREALASTRIPERLLVIGAGAVGVEFAYVYAMYGADVTVLEMADQMLPGSDAEVAAALERAFRNKGIAVRTGARFEALDTSGAGVGVRYRHEGEIAVASADQVLFAVGRRPRADDLGLEEVGVALDAAGFVATDAYHCTTVPSVFAIGDLAGGPLLAHKASEQGVAAVEHLVGMERPPLDPLRLPACVYAQPQVASIGWTEAEARAQRTDVRVGRFPFAASGKAVAAGHTEGFAKLVFDADLGELLGAHLIGAGATELIAELSLATQLEATSTELTHTVHAHPTLSEALWEAALDAEGRSLNC